MSAWSLEGFLKRWVDPLVHANLWVAFGAFALVHVTILSLDLGCGSKTPLFIFFLTLFTYNFQRLYKSKGVSVQSHSARHLWIARNNERLRMLMLVAMTGAVICAVFIDIAALLILAPFGAISLFYSIRILPSKGRKLGFRDVPYIKLFLIAATWVVVTVLFPVIDLDIERIMDKNIAMVALQRALFILAITIPFDIRDVHRDHPSKRTLAQVLGEGGARMVSVLLMLVYCVLVWSFEGYTDSTRYALALSGILTAALLSFSHSGRSERFFTFLVEGVMVLQWVLLFGFLHC